MCLESTGDVSIVLYFVLLIFMFLCDQGMLPLKMLRKP